MRPTTPKLGGHQEPQVVAPDGRHRGVLGDVDLVAVGPVEPTTAREELSLDPGRRERVRVERVLLLVPSSRALCSRLTRSAELNSARNTAFDDVTGAWPGLGAGFRLGRVQVEGRSSGRDSCPWPIWAWASFPMHQLLVVSIEWVWVWCACASTSASVLPRLGAAPGRSPSRVPCRGRTAQPGHPPNRAPGRTST